MGLHLLEWYLQRVFAERVERKVVRSSGVALRMMYLYFGPVAVVGAC